MPLKIFAIMDSVIGAVAAVLVTSGGRVSKHPAAAHIRTPIWLKDQYVPNYQFKIGQQVSLRTAAQIKAPRGAYQIIQRFAARSGTLRYLIRSLEETEYRQIVDEADLAKY